MVKRFRVTQIIAMLLVVGCSPRPACSSSKRAADDPDNFSVLAEQVGPAVVNIQVEKATRTKTFRVSSRAIPSA